MKLACAPRRQCCQNERVIGMEGNGVSQRGVCMKSMRLIAIVVGLTAALAFASPLRAEPSATGLWEQVDEKGRVGAWFQFVERDGTYQGTLVKAFLQPGEKPPP